MSTVYFVGDRVVGWKGTLDFPLKLRMEPAQPERRANEYFAIGASASEVATIQGIPTEVRGDVWAYGPSEVFFRAGRVVGWKNSPQHPLNVHGVPTSPRNSATER
jgi:plastocyanin